jgi:Kef-type K+ transport system membrane component KefB
MSAIHQMLVAMGVILTLPYLVWRLGRTNAWAPLVVIQILMGIVLGPGLLGAAYPSLYSSIFTDDVLLMLSGIAAWAVILFVWLAGLELDLAGAWAERRDGMVTAACALLFPLMMGAVVGWGLMLDDGRWLGEGARPWQFALGIGMACAVTALPILMLFMRQLGLLRTPLGQRVLRYASIDDIAIWAVLAVVVWDLDGLLRQVGFLIGFIALSRGLRVLIPRLPSSDRWFVGLIWLCWVALSAHWAGLHYMVGAFLAGAVMERNWFEAEHLDRMRDMVLLTLMPVFFLSTGLRTQWALGDVSVLLMALLLLVVAIVGKGLGVSLASRWLRWPKGQARLVMWLLQTKALIMIIFSNILLDKQIISGETFTALLLMAAFSTVLTLPMATRALSKVQSPPESAKE